FLRRGDEADAVFTQALDELAGADTELEILLEAGLIINEWFVPSRQRKARELLEQVRSRLADETAGEKHLLALVAFHDARAVASSAAATVPLALRALSGGTLVREQITGAGFIGASAVLALADRDEALAVYEDALAAAHRRGSTFGFAAAKVFRANTLLMRGDLA